MLTSAQSSRRHAWLNRLAGWPWWLILIGVAGAVLGIRILTDALYASILVLLLKGLGVTLAVTACGFILAFGLGLTAALCRVSSNVVLRQLATLYVEFVRGVPILVLLFTFVFVATPPLVELMQAAGLAVEVGDIPMVVRATLALAFAYGAFEAETLRAGIESIAPGQWEAARSLGLGRTATLCHVILPQALRRVLPTLGNDLIALLKDSSLVSLLGVPDITNEARLYTTQSFRYAETYQVLAFVYLALTLLLSLGVRMIERRVRL
jgi:polar amino acid transport system permease protein